jgi:SAM-dependent methyltransferase
MLRELAPREGDVVLELAAGVGDTGFDAAARLGERGRLITSDFSPAMLAAARRRGAERGVANVEYRIVDAERIELDEDSVDGVLCRFGFMLMDSRAALAGTRRVLRPGGRVALAVWGALERNPWVTVLGMPLTVRGHVPPLEPPPAPGPFSMASAERTTGLLRDAGFTEVRTEEVPVRLAVPDVDEYIALVGDTAGPIALALRGLSEADRADLRADVEDALGPFTAATGYVLPGVALCAVAR